MSLLLKSWVGGIGGGGWKQYWSCQPEVLFFGLYSDISGGQMPNRKMGSSDYLTVAGAVGSETYQCPNTAPYIAADTDNIWFKTDETQRTVTTAELIGYDLQRTPVKYEDDIPNEIVAIIILNAAVTGSKRDRLFKDMILSPWWDDSYNDYGHIKDNRSGEQLLWTPEVIATIYDTFTDTDGTLLNAHIQDTGGTWSVMTYNVEINGNKARGAVSGSLAHVCTLSDTAEPDMRIDIDIPNSDNYNSGLIFRRNTSTQNWRVNIARVAGGTPTIYISKNTTVVSQVNITHEVGVGTLRVVVTGNNFDVYWKGLKVIDAYASDGSWNTVKYHGMLIYYDATNSRLTFDNFTII